MIARSALKEFLNRHLRDSRKAKRFTDRVLDKKVAALGDLGMKTFPRRHQKVGLLLGAKHPGYMYLFDMGLGKTWMFLALFNYWKRLGKVKHALVLVPNAANIEGWREQIQLHAPQLTVVGLSMNGREARQRALDLNTDITIMTYMGWCNLICKSKKQRGAKKPKWVIHKPTANRLEKKYDMVGWDEIHMLMHRDSLFTRTAHRLARKIDVRYGMTGTPFGKNKEPIWAQMYATDKGETLGETLGLFRAAFFTEEENPFSGWPTYKFDKRKKWILNRMIRHGSIRYTDDECQDLPKIIPINVPVIFPAETWAYHKRLVEELAEARTSFKLTEDAWNRMRQIASGYLTVKDPEGEKVQIVFKENPKLDALIAKLKEIPANRKVVVFLHYKITGNIVCERLKKEKITYERLYSGTVDKVAAVSKFKHAENVRVLVASSSGALGHNLQMSRYCLLYEVPSDPIIYKQMYKRLHRDGQEHRVRVIHFLVRGSIEERIMKSLSEDEDLFNAVVNGTKRLFGVKVECGGSPKRTVKRLRLVC